MTLVSLLHLSNGMRGSRNFCQMGSSSDNVFLVDEEKRDDPNNTKSGPSLSHQQNPIKMVFRWWANVGQKLNAGLVAL